MFENFKGMDTSQNNSNFDKEACFVDLVKTPDTLRPEKAIESYLGPFENWSC
jgi:hypothetical protein